MFGFGGKDWNVVGILFETPHLYRVNGNRGKGHEAVTIRDNVKKHPRTIFWAVFDQKGAFLEGEAGMGKDSISPTTLSKLVRELHTNPTVRQVLASLEKGEADKLARALEWTGYPKKGEAAG